MKSLVEEASSVVKAIEKAWSRAGKPNTFSVKVFENPETNFFGFTTKSAKVGIFYEEEAPVQTTARKPYAQNRDQRSSQPRTQSKGRQTSSYSKEPRTDSDSVAAQPRRNNNFSHDDQPVTREPREAKHEQTPRPVREQRTQEPRPAYNQRAGFEAKPHAEFKDVTPRDVRPSHSQREEDVDSRPSRDARPGRYDRNSDSRENSRDSRYNNRNQEDSSNYREDRQPRTPRFNDEHHDELQATDTHEAPAPRREQRDYGRSDNRQRDNRRSGGPRDRNSSRSPREQRPDFHQEDRDNERHTAPSFEERAPEYTEQPMHTQAPEASNPVVATPSLAPQRRVLKVSSRRYSSPVKTDKSDE